jgi:hypothetical protein
MSWNVNVEGTHIAYKKVNTGWLSEDGRIATLDLSILPEDDREHLLGVIISLYGQKMDPYTGDLFEND